MLVQDIFTAAMEDIGAVSLDEVPDESEMARCMRHANLMLDSWSARRLLQLSETQEHFSLIGGKESYTIGVGQDFNTSKPINISSAFIRDGSGYDYPVDIKPRELFESYADKFQSQSRPEALFYDAGQTQQATQIGTISFYPSPDSSDQYTVYLNSQKYFTEFQNLTDDVTFTPAYYDAIVKNLAVRLWRVMGRQGPVPSDLKEAARSSLKIIETMNARNGVANISLGIKGGTYNIYTDT